MKDDQKKIKLVIAGIILMFIGLLLFMYMAIKMGDFKPGNMLGALVVVLLTVIFAIFAMKRLKAVKRGEPYEDEFSKKVLNMSASRSFFISFYWLLAIMLFEPIFANFLFESDKLNAEQALGGGIIGMTLVFLANWFYYQNKGIK